MIRTTLLKCASTLAVSAAALALATPASAQEACDINGTPGTPSGAANSLECGTTATASDINTTAVGSGATASDEDATAVGFNSISSGFHSTAVGGLSDASAIGATAIGWEADSTGARSTSLGNSAKADRKSVV